MSAKTKNISQPSRISILGFVMAIVSLTIILRLGFWQIYNQQHVTELAARQIYASKTNLAYRGQIMTSDKTPIVSNQPGYSLSVDLRHLVIDKNELAQQLASYTWQMPDYVINEASSSPKIIMDELQELTRIRNLLSNSQSKYITISQHLNLDSTQQKSLSQIKGLVIIPQPNRTYTHPVPMSHVLGFVGKDEIGNPVGRYGLEGYYELELAGRSGVTKQETDARGRAIPFGQNQQSNTINGRTLVTSIDRSVQYILEKELLQGLSTYDAVAATAVVMDPATGEILAMASTPGYHPGWYEVFPHELYPNPAVAASYEPGSIFKVLVMAGALDNGSISLNTICPCNNSVTIGSNVISNFDNGVYPNSTLVDILKHSDNIGMVYIANQMGIPKMVESLTKFGIGQKTNIDLEEEMTPALRAINQWREIDLATASFGQGVAVTPIQMTTAVGAIANHGVLMEPHIVKQIIDGDKTIDIQPVPVRQAISSQTATYMSKLMADSFEFFITNHARKDLKGFKIAGKTGTAQIPIQGVYDEENVMASFIGFAPYDNPKFVMIVALSEPKSANFASQTAAPLWFTIAKQLFTHWSIQPEL